jgi:hypothetical protein
VMEDANGSGRRVEFLVLSSPIGLNSKDLAPKLSFNEFLKFKKIFKKTHKGNSSQNRGKDQPTESHIYTRDEHHNGTNMDRNQGIVTQNGEQIKLHKKQV